MQNKQESQVCTLCKFEWSIKMVVVEIHINVISQKFVN
jgi:hypothetical protein